MFIYIFPFVGQLTDHYHCDGGLVVAANGGMDRVKELIQAENEKNGSIVDEDMEFDTYSRARIELTEDEMKDVVVYKIEGDAPEAIFVFPDAGCC